MNKNMAPPSRLNIFNCYGLALGITVAFGVVNMFLFEGKLPVVYVTSTNSTTAQRRMDSQESSRYSHMNENESHLEASNVDERCPEEGYRYFQDNTLPDSITHNRQSIPKVIHMTSSSRCLTPDEWKMAESWKEALKENYSIYLYDAVAVDSLLNQFWAYVPHLQLFLNSCLALFDEQFRVKTDLVRYLVLWQSGGIVIDLESSNIAPGDYFLKHNENHDRENDAVMILDHEENSLPSRAVLAAAPHHPFMFLALSQSLTNFKELRNILPDSVSPYSFTGPGALQEAFRSFVNFDDSIVQDEQPARGGRYTGLDERSVTVLYEPPASVPALKHNIDTFSSTKWIYRIEGAPSQPRPPDNLSGPPDPNRPVPQCLPRIYASAFPQATTRTDILPLKQITGSDKQSMASTNTTCPPNLHRFEDLVLPESITHHNRKIPRVVHITGKTRCLTKPFYDNMERWKLANHSVYFHDDEAVDRLLNKFWIEFPHLQRVRPCIQSGAGIADLWRYIVLWEYGGLYSDMDACAGLFLLNGTAIAADDDAFLVIERGRFLAQYWLSASPRHPLMFAAVYQALQNLMELKDVGGQYVPTVTGPRAIVDGFEAFLGRRGKAARFPKPGHYVGLNNRTATVNGPARKTASWINRGCVNGKATGYKHMGIVNYRKTQNRPNNVTCFARMLREVNSGIHNQIDTDLSVSQISAAEG